MLFYCRTTSASTAPRTPRRTCCPTHCASYCAPYQPLLRAISGWIRSPPPARERFLESRFRAKREQPDKDKKRGLLPENQGQNLALTVLHLPNSLGNVLINRNSPAMYAPPQKLFAVRKLFSVRKLWPEQTTFALKLHHTRGAGGGGVAGGAGKRGGNKFRTENGSSQGQNLVLTGLCVPSSLDSGPSGA